MLQNDNKQFVDCPKCGEKIEITQALMANIEKDLKKKFREDYDTKWKLREEKLREETERLATEKYEANILDLKNQVLEKNKKIQEVTKLELDLKKKNRELDEKEKNIKTQLEEQLAKQKEDIIQKAKEDVQKENSIVMKDMKNQLSELTEKLSEAQNKEIDLLKQKRDLESAKKELELEVQRTLDLERSKLVEQGKNRSDEEYKLKFREKEDLIKSMQKTIEDLKRKSEQGSQQSQGEAQELELEEFLSNNFSGDDIVPVPKGKKGADVLHYVINNYGQKCGTIIWESKRTKNWSDGWISKLKEDQREAKADIPIIVSQTLPDNINHIGQIDGVWIISFQATFGIATILRENLIQLNQIRNSKVGQDQKKHELYNYLCSNEFKQRIEGIVEAFSTMQVDLDKEKTAILKQWSKREKQIENVIKNTSGMYGDLQALIGSSLPIIQNLELPLPDTEALEEEALPLIDDNDDLPF